MSTLHELKQQLEEAEDGLNTCHNALSLDPNDADALEMLPMCQEQVNDLKAQISALRAQQNSASPPQANDAASAAAKYDMTKHPKFRGEAPPTLAEETRVLFKVGDFVQAKYSADKQWYPATIVSQTGSPSDPVYTVKFTGYPDKEQKRKYEVRAPESKKRKAEGNPLPPPPAAPTGAVPPPPPPMSPDPISNGTVISAAASIDPNLVPKREPSKVSDGPTRMAPAPKKLKGNRTLEKSKSSWNDWQKSGPKKPAVGGTNKLKKDSQFRTPDLPNGKVGFTGSGKPMTKDQTRAKWNYGQTKDDD